MTLPSKTHSFIGRTLALNSACSRGSFTSEHGCPDYLKAEIFSRSLFMAHAQEMCWHLRDSIAKTP